MVSAEAGPRPVASTEGRRQSLAGTPVWVRIVDRLCDLLGALSALGVMAIAIIIGFEVASRTIWGQPTSWVVEYAIYLMIATAFLGAGYAHKAGAHVRADLGLMLLSEDRRLGLELVAAWIAMTFVALAAWNAALHVYSDYVHDTRAFGVMQTAMWLPKLAMPAGLFGLLLSMLAEVVRLRPVGGARRTAPLGLLLAAAVALPFVPANEGPLGGPVDWQTALVIAATLAASGLWSGWRVMLLAIAALGGLGIGFGAVQGASNGYVLLGLTVATLTMLVLGVRIAFALGVVAAAGLLLLLPFPQPQVIAERAWSSLESYTLTALPMFVLMGALLFRSGLSGSIFALTAYWLRWLPGGLAHASVAACGIFAAVSGSSVAAAATIGAVACPEMDKRGYDRRLSYGTVAAGGTLGILIPPSIAMLVYGSATGVPIPQLFVAGILPGLLLMASFMAVIALWTAIRPMRRPTAEEIPAARAAVWQVLPVLLLIFCVVGSMYLGIATPTEAGALGAIAAFVLCVLNRGIERRGLVDSLFETAKVTSFILMIVIAAGIMTYVFDFLRAPNLLLEVVRAADLQSWMVVLLVGGIYVLLGMFIDPLSMMLMTLPVAFPLMTSLGHDPVWFGVFLVLLIEIGLITPPVGMNLFVLRGISPDVSIAQISYGALAFVGALIANLLLLYLFPEIVTWLPSAMS